MSFKPRLKSSYTITRFEFNLENDSRVSEPRQKKTYHPRSVLKLVPLGVTCCWRLKTNYYVLCELQLIYILILYVGILAGQSSSGMLGGREVKTSAPVSRRSWVRIPPESPVTFFRHSESTEYAVLYTRRCRATLNQYCM